MKLLTILVSMVIASAPVFADPLRAVSSDLRGVCAIDGAGAVHCSESDLTPIFDGRAIAIARRYVVDEKGTLYRWNPFASTLERRSTPFAVRDVAWSDAAPCILGTKGQLACENSKGAYELVEKTRVFVAIVGGSDSLWALDSKGGLWCLGRGSCAELRVAMTTTGATRWTDRAVATAFISSQLPERVPPWRVATGIARLISGGSSTCVDTDKTGTRICVGYSAPRIVEMPAADESVVASSYLCSRTKDSVTCAPIGDPHPDPRVVLTATVPHAIRMHAGDTKFCVETDAGELWCTPEYTYSFSKFGPVTWAKPRRK